MTMTEREELDRWHEIARSLDKAFPAGDYHLSKDQNLALNDAIDFFYEIEDAGNETCNPYNRHCDDGHLSSLETDFLRTHGFRRKDSKEATWVSTIKGYKNVTFPHGRIFRVAVAVRGGAVLERAVRIWLEVRKSYSDWGATLYVLCSEEGGERGREGQTRLLKSNCGSEDLRDAIMLAIALFDADGLCDSLGIQEEDNEEDWNDDESGKENAGFPESPSRIYIPCPCNNCPQEEKAAQEEKADSPPAWREPPRWQESQPTCYDRTITVSANNSTSK